jgi:DNA-binding transcriptional LysR family regulator
LKQLETTLGVLLVQRSGRFGGLTPEGERVLDWARRIVGDARAMRDEVRAMRNRLSGHLRLAVVPTATPVVASLTTGLRDRHPDVTFSIWSCPSAEVLSMMEDAEADAGVTYVGGEPLGRVRVWPLFAESYRLLVARDTPLGERTAVDWAEVATVKLSLLTDDMQNRRIIDRRLRQAGADIRPVLESNSMIVLMSHVRTGRWASVLPALIAQSLWAGGEADVAIRSIPIREQETPPMIGLVYPQREPLLPLTAALLAEARRCYAGPPAV